MHVEWRKPRWAYVAHAVKSFAVDAPTGVRNTARQKSLCGTAIVYRVWPISTDAPQCAACQAAIEKESSNA